MNLRTVIFTFLVTMAIAGGSYLFASNKQPETGPAAGDSWALQDSSPAQGIKTTDQRIALWDSRFQRDHRDYAFCKSNAPRLQSGPSEKERTEGRWLNRSHFFLNNNQI